MTVKSSGRSPAFKRTLLVCAALTIVLVGAAAYIYIGQQNVPKQHLIVSTTSSLYETGLLDTLKVEFEKRYPSINVSFISQGTGLAIQTAMRGDADMILVHDAVRELKFLKDGYGVNRKVIAYNFFVIVGPKEDPAKIRGLLPLDALTKIKESGESNVALWISRGDDSGTHAKEKSLWKSERRWMADKRYGGVCLRCKLCRSCLRSRCLLRGAPRCRIS